MYGTTQLRNSTEETKNKKQTNRTKILPRMLDGFAKKLKKKKTKEKKKLVRLVMNDLEKALKLFSVVRRFNADHFYLQKNQDVRERIQIMQRFCQFAIIVKSTARIES